jgi:5-methylcytosine-specific restriction endonuclease McrA
MNWQQIRLQVLDRDNHTCRQCGRSSVRLNIHHITHRSFGGLNILGNLFTLCGKCHRSAEPKHGIIKPTTIQLEEETRDRLKGFGKKGESYNDIVIRLMDYYEGKIEK